MSGEELKRHLEENGYNPSRMYNLLGMSSQAYNQALKAVDIKTSLLEKICEVTGNTMAFFYPNAYTTEINQTFNRGRNIHNGDGNIIENANNEGGIKLLDIIEEQKRTIADLREHKEDLQDIIKGLKSKLAEHGL